MNDRTNDTPQPTDALSTRENVLNKIAEVEFEIESLSSTLNHLKAALAILKNAQTS